MKKVVSLAILLLVLSAAIYFPAYATDEDDADEYEILFSEGFAYALKDGQAIILGKSDSSKFEWLFDDDDDDEYYDIVDDLFDDYDTDDDDEERPLVIPSRIDGYPVVAIGDEAFLETLYTAYILSEGIISIGDSAFAYCYYFDTIVIPRGVMSIGESAFANCEKLSNVVIPDSVAFIGDGAFGSDYDDGWSGTLVVVKGSYAEKYAQESGFTYVYGEPSGSFNGGASALAVDNLATRSGPSTQYRETGMYNVKAERVRVISLAYDGSGVCWVQCEVAYGSKLRRVYTGLKRFDTASFDLYGVPEEGKPDTQNKVNTTSKAMYGPGDGYDTYGSLTVDKGQTVTVISIENGYAQVEWTTSKQSYRAWVSIDTLDY